MTDRDRLIELLKNNRHLDVLFGDEWEEAADDLLANGVIVSPCKVGDKVYQTDGLRIYESTVMEITYTTKNVVYCTENICFDETAIGKSIFLTKEEAEARLKELGK